jgi:hypothetical protein
MDGDITVELRVLNYATCAQYHVVRRLLLVRLVGAGALLYLWCQRAIPESERFFSFVTRIC